MERKKLLTEYTDEELLGKVDEPNPNFDYSDNVKHADNVVEFLSFYNIKHGKNLVSHRLLYRLYKSWTKQAKSVREFCAVIAIYLKPDGKGYYYISENSLNLSKEAQKLLKHKLEDRTKVPQFKKHFDAYIEHYKLKPGKFFLEAFILFDLYDQFVYETKRKYGHGYETFIKFCRLYFESEKLDKEQHIFFGIDESIKDFITDEQITHLRKNKKLYGKKGHKKV